MVFQPEVRCHLIELNDQYVSSMPCDGYLTAVTYPELGSSQLVAPWPVPRWRSFDQTRVELHIENIRDKQSVKIMLFGTGGAGPPAEIYAYLKTHPWFAQKEIILHIYGEDTRDSSLLGVVNNGWTDEANIDPDEFDAGLLYYAADIYPDDRICLGSPTKLSKYIDWSLPTLSNRSVFSDRFLGGLDHDARVLSDRQCMQAFANVLLDTRRKTSVEEYASQLDSFIHCHGVYV